MRNSKLSADALEAAYHERRENVLLPIAAALQEHISDYFRDEPRIDRISARAKDVKSFVTKARKQEDGKPKYNDPLSQIQDQIGGRIVTFFLTDVDRLDKLVTKYFRAIEHKDHVPESEWEFGYFGRHYILLLPNDVVPEGTDHNAIPHFFELQIKTLFQHAWSEAEHDLGYKLGEGPLTSDQKRRLAFTSAQAWGADQIFNELIEERHAREI